MANRNATRHLLLVASVLLCFFVYMGYRLAGPGGNAESAAPAAQVAPPAGVPGIDVAAIAASGSGSAFPGEGALRPPSGPAGRPAAAQSSGGDEGPMLLSPIGSAEESAGLTPPPSSAATAASGAIVGLVPAAPIVRPGGASGADSGDAAPVAALPLAPPAVTPPPAAPPAGSLPPGLLTPPGGAEATSRGSGAGVPPAAPSAPAGMRSGSQSATPPPLAPPTLAAAPATPPPAAATTATAVASSDTPPLPPTRRERPAVVPPPDAVQPAGVLAAADDAPSDSLRMYVVRPGDTLSRIATRELGSISLADNIFLLNRDVIPDPDQLMAGVKIRLPVRSLGGMDAGSAVVPPGHAGEYGDGYGDFSAADPAAASVGLPGGMAGQQLRVHTVAPGDTLSSISMRYYGSSSGWRFLHEVNAKTIANPNRLTVGTELVVPPYGEEQ